MKKLAFYPIHYGSEYLGYSMESIRDSVDKIVVFYSANPTFGHKGDIPCPDNIGDIQNICNEFRAELFDITGKHLSRENEHRELATEYAKREGYQIVVAVDYDEIWKNLDEAIEHAANGQAYQYGIRGDQWVHFWKSFSEVNTDGFSPIRLFNLDRPKGTEELIYKGRIYHFSYAISEELMRYKISCHGHKDEIADTWFNEKWLNYKRGETKYLHPATTAYWIETKDFDKTTLPEFMRSHEKYND